MRKHRLLNIVASIKSLIVTRTIKHKLKKPKYTHLYIGTPPYGNLGDQQIRNSSVEFLRKQKINYIEISYRDFYTLMGNYWFKESLKYINTICLQGGGNFGDVYPKEELIRDDVIRIFKDKKIIIFPQTFYVEDKTKNSEIYVTKEIFDRHKNLIITAREEASYEAIKSVFTKNKVILTPDIVLSSDYSNRYRTKRKNKVLFLMRKDAEKAIDDNILSKLKQDLKQNYKVIESDTEVGYCVFDIKRDSELRKLFKKIASAKFVITDRLHGMIFCAITNTPCIVLSNYNHKIKSTYESWLKNYDYIEFATDISNFDINKLISKFKNRKNSWHSLNEKFKDLEKEI